MGLCLKPVPINVVSPWPNYPTATEWCKATAEEPCANCPPPCLIGMLIQVHILILAESKLLCLAQLQPMDCWKLPRWECNATQIHSP